LLNTEFKSEFLIEATIIRIKTMSKPSVITFLFLGLSFAAHAQDEPKLFSADDVFDLEYANDPRISPDGAQIVYERRANDIMTDNTVSNLWVVNVDGSNHRPLVSGIADASSPRWSADGERIAYVQATVSGTGIYVRWMDTGQTALLANLQKSPADLTWSPDGRWLAFVMSVPAESEPIAEPRAKPEGAEWSEPVKVIDTVQYRWDGRGFLEAGHEHIFVIPADGGSPRQLTSGDFNHEGPVSWTADGSSILFSANRDDGWELASGESDIYRVSVSDGTLTQLTDKIGGEHAPTMSPDGRQIAYIYDDNRMIPYRNSILHIMAPDGSGDRPLTAALDSSVNDIQWTSQRQIFFYYDQRAVRYVARVSLSGDFAIVAEGLGSTSLGRPYLSGSFTVSSNGTVAFTRGTAQRPAEVAVTGRRGTRVLTSLNDDLLNDRTLGEVTEIIYDSSFDGQEIQGWYITPPGYDRDKKYPLILEIHGGPHAAYGPYFSAEMQLMAAQGYVVFYDNHRGSTSYGEDFALLLHYKYSSPEDFADHMSGVDALIEKNIADPDNLFVTGGSAGGIASAYAIGLTDRFNAAAVAKPVVNWISKTLTADSYIGQISHQFPGMPWEAFEHYWQRSPLSLVGNMVTPTMLITGEEDYRTPISETEQLYQALKLKGVEVVMVRVPGSSHGIAGRPSRLVAKVDNILAWFARYRSDAESAAID
jgi:dipeptidyl aminopeptidase/acylaminoacyl peptidase